jgi:hypothetical protein
MNNLNKENFFDLMDEKYPLGMIMFQRYVDNYKKQVNWDKLFNSDSDYQNSEGKNAVAPKFHDLPYELQIGLLLKFAADLFPSEEGIFIGPEDAMESVEITLRKCQAIAGLRGQFNSEN